MKVIYMEQTILLMSQKDPEGTQELINSGIIILDKNNKPYLVVNTEEDARG